MESVGAFKARIEQLYGLYRDVTKGLDLVVPAVQEESRLVDDLTPPEFEELLRTEPTFVYARMGVGIQSRATPAEILERNLPGGANRQILVQTILVMIYQYWEETYRGRLATDAGRDKNAITSDLFGDLKEIRHSIIHTHGRAKSDIKPLKVLAPIKPGQPIDYSESEFESILTQVLSELDRLRQEHGTTRSE